jgi:hypothetical protein
MLCAVENVARLQQALSFDISGEPPAPAAIAQAREDARILREDIRRRNIRFLYIILALVATIMTIAIVGVIPMLDNPGAEPDIVGLFAYLTPYMFVALFVIGNTRHHQVIEKPRKALEAWMDGLTDATPEDLAQFDMAALPPEITAYLHNIAGQGRLPVKAEITAIRARLEASSS